MNRALVAGIIGVGAAVLGWMAIIVVARMWPGGHPPLSAYVAVPVLIGLMPLNLAGAILSFLAARRTPGSRWVAWPAAAANLVFLFLGLRVLFLRG